MVVLGAKWEGQAEQENAELLPKTLNSFSGFVWLAQILRTFTFCGELLRINGVTRDSWIEPQECRRFYIYRDFWLPSPPLVPSHFSIPLTCMLSSLHFHTAQGPSAYCGKGLSGLEHPLHTQLYWMAWRQCTLHWDTEQQEGLLNIGQPVGSKWWPYKCIWVANLVHMILEDLLQK